MVFDEEGTLNPPWLSESVFCCSVNIVWYRYVVYNSVGSAVFDLIYLELCIYLSVLGGQQLFNFGTHCTPTPVRAPASGPILLPLSCI